ncbi:MAG TPA: hypothetical protein VFO83_16725, partial [Aggregicoccus sp.]|nr:hypothetical protein [Aggregicoccus sp.]
LEESGQLKSETGSDIQKKVAIPAPKRALLDACERYVRYVPKGDKRVEIEFKAANIYYRYNHFDEAVLRFSEIALNYPEYKFENGERAAEIAANLILDSYNLLQDYAKVNEWARRFYNNDRLASGPFRDQLAKLIEQSSFKLVNQLEAKGEYARAAEAYLTFVAEFPKSEIADKALYNASVDFFKAKMVDRSIQTRQRIIQSYPRSSFIPACIYANAEAFEAIGDFSEAADSYELYVRGYERSTGAKSVPARVRARASKLRNKQARAGAAQAEKKDPVQVWEESKAQVALFNAATYRDGLGQYRAALKDRERFLELWPKSKDAEQVFLSIADLHEKSGAYARAMKHLEAYEREYLRFPSKVLEAEGRIAAIYEQKLRRPRDANRVYNRIYDYYEKLPRRTRKELDKPALAAVARAHLLRIEPDYNHYARLRLSWGRPASPQAFKASIKDKKKALDVVTRLYVETVQLGAADSGICALQRLGLAYENFADKVINAPMPPGTDEAMREELRAQFANEAQPLKDQAAEAFKSAVAKGHELVVYNDCFKKSLQLLRTTYAPEQFPEVHEDTRPLVVKHALAVQGGDLLSDIQPVPASAVQAPAKAAESQDLREDLESLTKQLRAKQASTPAESRSKNPDAQAPSDSSKKSSADSEEPEDFL